ncbi:MAG: peptidoglycan-binding protein [Rhodobacteraceae bacterium]|nr:peptidoglycan-binding protein [Paracoccaceae bacterium]
MARVDEIARDIVRREGGYVNDPDDPGGATNFGVTVHTIRRLGLDLTGDGQVDAQDVRRLNEAQAVQIFKDHYYHRPKISKLPGKLQASVFDMYVNAGGNAVKILQRMLALFGEVVSVDGALGPQTITAVKRVAASAPDHIVDAYGIERRNYYYRLADRRAASRKYARRRDGGKGGWIVRAEEFIAAKYHLSVRDHKERCAKWD